jgi:hypothetical protein
VEFKISIFVTMRVNRIDGFVVFKMHLVCDLKPNERIFPHGGSFTHVSRHAIARVSLLEGSDCFWDNSSAWVWQVFCTHVERLPDLRNESSRQIGQVVFLPLLCEPYSPSNRNTRRDFTIQEQDI